jgi:hypothetical protein
MTEDQSGPPSAPDPTDVPQPPKRKGHKTGGRGPGTPNKRTVWKKKKEAARLARTAALEAARIMGEVPEAPKEQDAIKAAEVIAEARTSGVKPPDEVLEDFLRLFTGMAAIYQPLPPGVKDAPAGREPSEEKFRWAAAMATQTAKDLLPYRKPRLSAVMVGAAIVSDVTVKGGMPDEFKPRESDVPVVIPPGTIISAEEPYDPEVFRVVAQELPKAVNE